MEYWFHEGFKMRWMVVAAVVAWSAVGTSAAMAEEAQSVIDMSEAAPGVIVSAIPSPPTVVEVLKFDDPVARARSAKKLRLAKKAPSPTLMLTRTERRQMELLVVSGKSGEPQGQIYYPDDSSQGGLDQLDLHRFFSRPRLVDEAGDDRAETDGLSPNVRLRLLMARLKAVEAHAINQLADADDEPLSESVRDRLKEARLKAVQAHQRKFS